MFTYYLLYTLKHERLYRIVNDSLHHSSKDDMIVIIFDIQLYFKMQLSYIDLAWQNKFLVERSAFPLLLTNYKNAYFDCIRSQRSYGPFVIPDFVYCESSIRHVSIIQIDFAELLLSMETTMSHTCIMLT